MQMLMNIAIVVQICAAVAVIILVLLQHGKGADLGAACELLVAFDRRGGHDFLLRNDRRDPRFRCVPEERAC